MEAIVSRSWRRRVLVLTMAATIVGAVGVAPALAAWTAGAPSSPGNVQPIFKGEGGRCPQVGSLATSQFRVSQLFVDRAYVIPSGPTITIDASTDQKTFSWSISAGWEVYDVTVKGADDPFNHYDFQASVGGPRTSDGALHAPLRDGVLRKLGAGFFCFSAVEGPAVGGIAGTKYDDLDADGAFDEGEPGVAEWPIWLFPGEGTPVSTSTDGSGNYRFDDLAPGTYTVCEVSNAEGGWTQSGPINNTLCSGLETGNVLADGGYVFEVVAGETDTGDFFNFNASFECGETISAEGDGTSASFTRIDDPNNPTDCDPSEVKTAELNILVGEGPTEVEFLTSGAIVSFRGTLTFTKSSSDQDLLVLQYDPGDDEGDFRNVPACTAVVFSGGEVVDANPGTESWCFTSVVATPVGGTQWSVTWQIFGLDDPKFR